MAKITRDEVIKIARISHIQLLEDEIEPMQHHLEAVLSYATCVQEIAATTSIHGTTSINIMREDVVIPTNPEKILAEAPQAEEDYFVVPRILENN
jgi:aspartyl-tRNA(Asn)/glutamyl-tRNA(Gln) amidotransferase subunit C